MWRHFQWVQVPIRIRTLQKPYWSSLKQRNRESVMRSKTIRRRICTVCCTGIVQKLAKNQTILIWLNACGRQPLEALCLLLMKMQWQSLQWPQCLPTFSSQPQFLQRMSSCTAHSCCLESWSHGSYEFHVWWWCCQSRNPWRLSGRFFLISVCWHQEFLWSHGWDVALHRLVEGCCYLRSCSGGRFISWSRCPKHPISLDDEVMLNVLRCHLTY